MSPWARMLYDPCNSPLVAGFFPNEGGNLMRVKKSIFNNSTGTCGYILWIDDYHQAGDRLDAKHSESSLYGGNLFIWSSDNPDTQPYNTRVISENKEAFGETRSDSFAQNSEFSSAHTVVDPAHSWVSGNNVQDARTISSCIRMKYTGQERLASGEVALIENLPIDSILRGAIDEEAVSVNMLFNSARHVQRLGNVPVEIKGRPSAASDTFRNSHATPFIIRAQENQSTGKSPAGRIQAPNVYGLAWRGISINADQPTCLFTYELTKNVEWRPEPNANATNVVPKARSGTPKFQSATSWLDNNVPGWTTQLTSALAYAGKYFVNRRRNQALQFHPGL